MGGQWLFATNYEQLGDCAFAEDRPPFPSTSACVLFQGCSTCHAHTSLQHQCSLHAAALHAACGAYKASRGCTCRAGTLEWLVLHGLSRPRQARMRLCSGLQQHHASPRSQCLTR